MIHTLDAERERHFLKSLFFWSEAYSGLFFVLIFSSLPAVAYCSTNNHDTANVRFVVWGGEGVI